VLAVCFAGSDRSRYIAEKLNSRGYFATSAGVLENHNYVTPEDLMNIGIIVFSSINEKNIFDKDRKLKSIVERNHIQIRVLNITESDKNRAHDSGNVQSLKTEISKQLDCVGLKDLESGNN
jgi:hypothetical protein